MRKRNFIPIWKVFGKWHDKTYRFKIYEIRCMFTLYRSNRTSPEFSRKLFIANLESEFYAIRRLSMRAIIFFCAAIVNVIFVYATCYGNSDDNSSHSQVISRTNHTSNPQKNSMDIILPEYNGVEQLLVLSSKWVIVVTTNTREVLDKINELSEGVYYTNADRFEINNQDWGALGKIKTLYGKYIAEARNLAGERDLDIPSYYTISSETDPNFNEPKNSQHPLRVTRYLPSLGKGVEKGEQAVHYGQYSYLELPFQLQNGHTYTIHLDNGKSVKFLYDELRTVSRAIKINQVGYLPDCKQKYAYLGCYLQEFGPMDFSYAHEYLVISAETGRIALSGTLKQISENPRVALKPGSKDDPNTKPFWTGENTYEIDLNGLNEIGSFFISIPGVGRSWTFLHTPDVYGEAFYICTRGLYHQRCGIAIGEPYTSWPRQICHTDPVYESESIPFIPPQIVPAKYNIFEVIGATTDLSKPTYDSTGGWHDAADWDKNILHYMNVFDLLYAYEIAPKKFYANQLNIPQSNSNVPDVLLEAEYGLRVWKKSMTENGGVSGLLETWTHPPMIDPSTKYSYSQRTRWSSLIYAAAAAQLALHLRSFDKELADEYELSAKKSYEFGNNPKNSLGSIIIHAATKRGQGEKYVIEWTENDEEIIPFIIHAKIRLYILTNDENYLTNLPMLLSKTPKPYDWPFSYRGFSPWLYHAIFTEKFSDKIPLTILHSFKKHYIKKADDLIAFIPAEPYRQTWPAFQDYWMGWGTNTMTNQSRCLLIAYNLTGDNKYRDAAILNLDYMLGNNPMGISWTTGLGYVYPIEIQHAVSELDGIPDPVPGITIYGQTGGMFQELKTTVWESPRPNGTPEKFMSAQNWNVPILRMWSCHPYLNTLQCEFTIHDTMSSMMFTTAMLIPNDWMPNEKLRNKKPTEKSRLFGYWYLP